VTQAIECIFLILAIATFVLACPWRKDELSSKVWRRMWPGAYVCKPGEAPDNAACAIFQLDVIVLEIAVRIIACRGWGG
jgi:hypothetical protein